MSLIIIMIQQSVVGGRIQESGTGCCASVVVKEGGVCVCVCVGGVILCSYWTNRASCCII